MWNSTRRGITILRRRRNGSKINKNVINLVLISAVCVIMLSSAIVFTKSIISASANANIANKGDNIIIESDASTNVQIYSEEQFEQATEIVESMKVSVLGEIMMGGTVGTSYSYNYKSAFRYVSEYAKKADYSIATLATNVVDLDELGKTSSKYVVTAEIEDAFYALGIDGINIATDHMLDFGRVVFDDTKKILKEDYDLIGLTDNITYIEKGGIQIAIIGICNETIGSASNYNTAQIMTYNLSKIKELISTAKETASTVIVMPHLGNANYHTVTNAMRNTCAALINAGADVVIGTHALGVYPVEIYNGKPIIYSAGYFISDTTYAVGRKSGIFDFTFNQDGKLEKIEITPTYINNKKQVVLMEEHDEKQTLNFLKYIAGKNKNYSISENKLIMEFN